MSQKYLTTAEVADVLRLSVWQVVNLCREGKLPATKPSGQWLISEIDLDAFLASGSNQPAASVEVSA